MPIENIEIEKTVTINRLTAITSATLASLAVFSANAEAVPRPAPSGETCAQKVAYYAGQGALFGKVKVSDCKKRPQIKNNILQIEAAGRYFDYNPIGGVAVAACESTLYERAEHKGSGASGLFQQIPKYWNERLATTRSYIKKNSGKTPRVKLVNNRFNARSNSFVSVYMLARKAGPKDWAPSRHCWNRKYQEVAGSRDRVRHWFATKKITS